MTDILNQIETRRYAADMSPRELAKSAGMYLHTFKAIQNGEPPLTTQLLHIADALHCSIADLVEYDEITDDRIRFLEAGRRCSTDKTRRAELLKKILEYTNPVIEKQYSAEKAAGEQITNAKTAAESCTEALGKLNEDGLREALRQIELLAQIPKFQTKE